MQDYIIGAILLAIGLYLVFFRKASKPEETFVSAKDIKTDIKETQKEEKKKEEAKEEEKQEDDVDPSKWPKLKPLGNIIEYIPQDIIV